MSTDESKKEIRVLPLVAPRGFEIPISGFRDPHFAQTRSYWIECAVPGKGRPNPPVKSYRSLGPGRGRRIIDYESALAHQTRLRDEQIPKEVEK